MVSVAAVFLVPLLAKIPLIEDDDAYAAMLTDHEKSLGIVVRPSLCSGCIKAAETVASLLMASSLQRRHQFFFCLLNGDVMERLQLLYAAEQPATVLLFMREQVEKLRGFSAAAELRAAAPGLLSRLQRRMEGLSRQAGSAAELREAVTAAGTLFACLPPLAGNEQICQVLAEENLAVQFVLIKDADLRKAVMDGAGLPAESGALCALRSDALVREGESGRTCQPLGSAEADKAFVTFQSAPRVRDSSAGADLLKSLFWKKHVVFFLYGSPSPQTEAAFRRGVVELPRVAHFFVIGAEDQDEKFVNLFAMARLTPERGHLYAVYVDQQRQVRFEATADFLEAGRLRAFFWQLYRRNAFLLGAVGLAAEAAEQEL